MYVAIGFVYKVITSIPINLDHVCLCVCVMKVVTYYTDAAC